MRYYALKNDFPEKEKGKRKKVIKNLVDLQKDLDEKVPEKLFNENLIIATWNIRDFDSNKFGHGPREKESFYYIAEIISAFDLVAVQEVNDDITALKKVMYILGDDWDYIMTDVAGNNERMVFVYDRKRVSFEKLAGEIVLDNKKLVMNELQFSRTPFLVAFKSGWFNFKLCTVHIYFGEESGPKFKRRVEEIAAVSKSLKTRADKYKENLILLGDFNITSPEHETMKALTKNKFKIPEPIQKKPQATNMYRTKHYDQIAYRERKGEVVLGDSENNAGVYNFYDIVYKAGGHADYTKAIKSMVNRKVKEKNEQLEKTSSQTKKATLTKQINKLNELVSDENNTANYYERHWRTFQMSDHLPMWVELKINFSQNYLKKISEEVEENKP